MVEPIRYDDAGPIRSRWRNYAIGLVPLVLLLAAIRSLSPESSSGPGNTQQADFGSAGRFRTVVLILDSAGTTEMFDAELMPFLSSLQASSLSGRSRSCAAKTTFPCIKSIFEGREATMGTTLQDFSAFASSRTTWPNSLAALGLRLVVASDHTLNRLYPHAFVDALNYEDLHVPLLERDAFVYRKARQWLDDPTIDVLILHIIGTDKVSHEYPVRGLVYREKYREVDDFIRETAGRLGPQDYLYAISDHGHNELGGHTEDAAYLVHGPLFPPATHEDLAAEEMLFLLSLPYGLTLPSGYEGQIRTDLTLLTPEFRDKWLSAQARFFGVPIAGEPADKAQALLNEHITRQRTEAQRAIALDALWRSAPFCLAAALFLIGELRLKGEAERKQRAILLQIALFALGLVLTSMAFAAGAWLFVVGGLIRCGEKFGLRRSAVLSVALGFLGAMAFWIFPAGLTWIHNELHRPYAFIVFYAAAFFCGLALARLRGVKSWQGRSLDMLWTVGIAVWLLGYFGPLGYSLTRHGSFIILAVVASAAIVIAGGFRSFACPPALLLPGLLPVILFDVESFNLKYPLLDRIPELGAGMGVVLCGIAGALFVVALNLRRGLEWRTNSTARNLGRLLWISLWLVLGSIFFQFDFSKLIGCLLACVWFASCLELFARVRLPVRWFALVSAVFLFILLTFFLNGFAFSHVDFRFAANKIFPFEKEAYRAPQLIFWAMLKYGFALLPALAVIRAAGAGREIWTEILLLGWWRELIIVASALGLAVFNARGMRELCSEEIYFWTFLNLIFFAACLIVRSPARSRTFRPV